MGTFIQYIFLLFSITLVEALHISVFRYGHIGIALLLFFVFFFRPQTALFGALVYGFLEDVMFGPFGFHILIYPLISLSGIIVCSILLTNKSFLAFLLLGISGFFIYHIVMVLFLLMQGVVYQQPLSFPAYFSFEYAKQIVYGLFFQSVFLLAFYSLQHRRIRSSRGYLMFSE